MGISVFSSVLCAFSISFLMNLISVFSRINICMMTEKYLNDDAMEIIEGTSTDYEKDNSKLTDIYISTLT